jgi:hypothetical protein
LKKEEASMKNDETHRSGARINHQPRMGTFGTFAGHGATFASHGATFASYGETFASHDATGASHDAIFEGKQQKKGCF